jgi:hypothetical protein
MLCKYGYFFHISSNEITDVKEDSEFYRFQAPYFWISTSWNAGKSFFNVILNNK